MQGVIPEKDRDVVGGVSEDCHELGAFSLVVTVEVVVELARSILWMACKLLVGNALGSFCELFP